MSSALHFPTPSTQSSSQHTQPSPSQPTSQQHDSLTATHNASATSLNYTQQTSHSNLSHNPQLLQQHQLHSHLKQQQKSNTLALSKQTANKHLSMPALSLKRSKSHTTLAINTLDTSKQRLSSSSARSTSFSHNPLKWLASKFNAITSAKQRSQSIQSPFNQHRVSSTATTATPTPASAQHKGDKKKQHFDFTSKARQNETNSNNTTDSQFHHQHSQSQNIIPFRNRNFNNTVTTSDTDSHPSVPNVPLSSTPACVICEPFSPCLTSGIPITTRSRSLSVFECRQPSYSIVVTPPTPRGPVPLERNQTDPLTVKQCLSSEQNQYNNNTIEHTQYQATTHIQTQATIIQSSSTPNTPHIIQCNDLYVKTTSASTFPNSSEVSTSQSQHYELSDDCAAEQWDSEVTHFHMDDRDEHPDFE